MTDRAYTAYSYLTAGEDFRRFELAPEFGRVPPHAGGLSAGLAERAAALLRDSLVISLHDHPAHTIESVMDHFQYCADLVGLEQVAFGPDTLYGDHVALHRVFGHLLGIAGRRPGPAFDPVAYVDGLENPTERFGNICGWLVGHGYSDDEIRAVLGGTSTGSCSRSG